MLKPSFTQYLLALGTFQLGVLAVGGSPTKSEALSWNQAINLAQNRRLAEGSLLPQIAFRNDNGTMHRVSFPATLVFRSSCSCEDIVVGNWMTTAKSSQINALLLCVDNKMPLKRASHLVAPSQHLARCYSNEVTPLLKRDQQLPLAVHVNAQGVITTIEEGSQ